MCFFFVVVVWLVGIFYFISDMAHNKKLTNQSTTSVVVRNLSLLSVIRVKAEESGHAFR